MLDCATTTASSRSGNSNNNNAITISTYDTLVTQRAGHAKDHMRDMQTLIPPSPPTTRMTTKDKCNIDNLSIKKDDSNNNSNNNDDDEMTIFPTMMV